MNRELKKRLLSLAWRGGAAAIIGFLAVFLKVLPDLGISEVLSGVLILVINEVTKTLNKKYDLGSKALGAIQGK